VHSICTTFLQKPSRGRELDGGFVIKEDQNETRWVLQRERQNICWWKWGSPLSIKYIKSKHRDATLEQRGCSPA
jgi:hypothetical protein